MPEGFVSLLVVAVLSGGLGVAVLQRIFSNRDAKKKTDTEDRQTIDAASVEFFKGLREELSDCRAENRRVNDKCDTQAAELYTLKGAYEAGKEQLERVTGEYFTLLQKYTAALLENEVLRAALKDRGIEIPSIATLVAAKAGTSEETTPTNPGA